MIHILVFRRPNIESADHPLNTGSKSNLQDFLDKRLIKLFLISIYFFSSRNKTSRRKPEKDTRIREFQKNLCSYDGESSKNSPTSNRWCSGTADSRAHNDGSVDHGVESLDER